VWEEAPLVDYEAFEEELAFPIDETETDEPDEPDATEIDETDAGSSPETQPDETDANDEPGAAEHLP